MPWIALDCGLPEHAKMAALPTDAVRYGWLVTLLKAKLQSKPGRFTSERHFREVLHRRAKYLPHYLAAGLLERDEDGALVIHDWQRYQWAAAKARQREDNSGTPIRQNEDHHAGARAVPVPVLSNVDDGGSTSSSAPEAEPDVLTDYYNLTGRYPTGRLRTWLQEMADAHGHEVTGQTLGAVMAEDATLHTLLSRTQARLEQAAHEQAKRHAAKERERLDEERRRIESMPEDQRKANLERLGAMMADKGLLKAAG